MHQIHRLLPRYNGSHPMLSMCGDMCVVCVCGGVCGVYMYVGSPRLSPTDGLQIAIQIRSLFI